MTKKRKSEVNNSINTASYWCSHCGGTHPLGKCPLAGKCHWCKKRPAELHFGDMLSFTHGGYDNCCRLCAAEMQLAHAVERAAEIPKLEAEIAEIKKELAPA